MFLTTCTICGHERIHESHGFNEFSCASCSRGKFGLIDYSWIREDEAERLSNEKNIPIES